MKNKGFGIIVIIITVGVIVVLGGGAYFLTTKKSTSPEPGKIIEKAEQIKFKIEEINKIEELIQEEKQVEEVVVEKEPLDLIETPFSSPYLVSWMEGSALLSLTKASLGTTKTSHGLRKLPERGNYAEGERIHALTLYLKVKTGNEYYSVRMNMRREINKEGDLIKPNTQQFRFPDSGGTQASPNTTYSDEKIIFVVPEAEKEFYFAISDFYFSLTVEDGEIKLKRENWGVHRHNAYDFNVKYPEQWFKEVCEKYGEDKIIFDPTKVGAKSGCDCEAHRDCYYGAVAVSAYLKGWAYLDTLTKPYLVEGFKKTSIIIDGKEAVRLFKEDKPSEVYVYIERSNYILELAYRDVYGLKHLRTFNRMAANLNFSY